MRIPTGIISGLLIVLVLSLSACELPSPEEYRKLQHLPSPDYVANVPEGRREYQTLCVTCHGIKGIGTNQGPPLVHKTYRPDHHVDIAFHWAIRDGVKQHHWNFGDMPAIPDLSPEGAANIIAYIRSEQRKVGIR